MSSVPWSLLAFFLFLTLYYFCPIKAQTPGKNNKELGHMKHLSNVIRKSYHFFDKYWTWGLKLHLTDYMIIKYKRERETLPLANNSSEGLVCIPTLMLAKTWVIGSDRGNMQLQPWSWIVILITFFYFFLVFFYLILSIAALKSNLCFCFRHNILRFTISVAHSTQNCLFNRGCKLFAVQQHEDLQFSMKRHKMLTSVLYLYFLPAHWTTQM